MVSAPNRPDLSLINVAFDPHGVHGHMFFRDPPDTEPRRVIVDGTGDAASYRVKPAHGDKRGGWEPFLTEAGWLMALIRPDALEERS